MKAPDLCIHHMPCADGFAAAWAVWKRWPQTVFHPGVYGEPPPDVTGKNVLIVDFSYKRPVMEMLAKSAASITVLDHHKSAEADLAGFPGATFDMSRSGAMLAWNYCFPDKPAPALVEFVQDRDLWRFGLHGTREIAAVLFSEPYDFQVWDEYADRLQKPAQHAQIVAEGQAIERKHFKDIDELLKLTTREMVIGGHRVRVANLPYTMSSDAANALAEGSAFGACYYDNAEGKRVFSLRSKADGADVSEVAVSYGGGGHARASGFTAPIGWEGDASDGALGRQDETVDAVPGIDTKQSPQPDQAGRIAELESGLSKALDAVASGTKAIEFLRAELSAAIGYMENARIDLESGATKATAIKTITGGTKRAHQTPPPQSGWRLVPEEPTDAMLEASEGAVTAHLKSLTPDERILGTRIRFGKQVASLSKPVKHALRWKAMLAACPPPPMPSEGWAGGTGTERVSMPAPSHVSDWKPCTIIRGPLKLVISGGDQYERRALHDLLDLMLKETRLSAKVSVWSA